MICSSIAREGPRRRASQRNFLKTYSYIVYSEYSGQTQADAPIADQGCMTSPALHTAWTLWELCSHAGGDEYRESFRPLGTFDDLKGFAELWGRIPRLRYESGWSFPASLTCFSAVFSDGNRTCFVQRPDQASETAYQLEGFALMRKGVRPEWEDAANRCGGEWSRRSNWELRELDQLWEGFVFALIGGEVDPTHSATGCRVVDKVCRHVDSPCDHLIDLFWLQCTPGKRQYRLELWFEDDQAKKSNAQLRNQLQAYLQTHARVRQSPRLTFRTHRPDPEVQASAAAVPSK